LRNELEILLRMSLEKVQEQLASVRFRPNDVRRWPLAVAADAG
jgi:hypothetical protein